MVAVAFVVHPERPVAAELAARAGAWLEERGHTVTSVVDSVDPSGKVFLSGLMPVRRPTDTWGR